MSFYDWFGTRPVKLRPLSEERLARAVAIATQRMEFNERIGVYDEDLARDALEKTRDMLRGTCAEFALADHLGGRVNESVDFGSDRHFFAGRCFLPGGADVIAPWGETIDVKSVDRHHAYAALRVSPAARERADLFVLLAGWLDEWRLCGWATAAEVLAAPLQPLRGKPCHILRQGYELRSAISFVDMAETRTSSAFSWRSS